MLYEVITGLEEWIDFRSARENCEAEGLSDFIKIVLDQKLDKSVIIDTFIKRFYRLWLDAVLPNYPAVYNFRSRNQEETIKHFSRITSYNVCYTKLLRSFISYL